jgi:hypothetical protein
MASSMNIIRRRTLMRSTAEGWLCSVFWPQMLMPVSGNTAMTLTPSG